MGITDEGLEQLVDEVIQIFRLVKAKDVFEEFYTRGLCRRILLKKSASYDAEKSMIQKLKNECGDQFTAKSEGMMKDLNVSDQFMKEYLKVKGSELPASCECHFYVLSHSSWPISTQFQATLP